MACGTGRHLLGLVNRGYRPFGVDISTECIRMAKKNCPLISDQIIEDDFLSFAENLNQKFDLVIVAGASLGYDVSFQSSMLYVDKLIELLNPDGSLFIQFINKDWAQSKFKNKTTFWAENEDFFILDKREVVDNRLVSEKVFLTKGSVQQNRYSDSVFLFTVDEIKKHVLDLNLNNVKNIEVFGGFDGSDYHVRDSAMPVVVIWK